MRLRRKVGFEGKDVRLRRKIGFQGKDEVEKKGRIQGRMLG
jgi:hypothetical protein